MEFRTAIVILKNTTGVTEMYFCDIVLRVVNIVAIASEAETNKVCYE